MRVVVLPNTPPVIPCGQPSNPSISPLDERCLGEELKCVPHYGEAGETMAAKKSSSKIEALTALPGIGAATAKKLVAAKLDSVSKVAGAGAKKLQDAGLSAAVAKKVGAAAKAAEKGKEATKATATKAKTVAKKTASKAKSTAKKTVAASKETTSKAKTAAKKTASKATETAKSTASKATSTAKKTLPSKKSDDGRKGGTLKIPRSVRDMPWFNKK
ncbi:MAG: hypothetical protein MG2_0053 [uncultured Candidatus Poseidoniales archaeon]|nr:MAG: hypothetical protein MG2_0053 [uncultured Candidatus Poseidoniales archaeon]